MKTTLRAACRLAIAALVVAALTFPAAALAQSGNKTNVSSADFNECPYAAVAANGARPIGNANVEGQVCADPSEDPSPSDEPTPSPTDKPTPTPTATPEPEVTPTPSPSDEPTPSPSDEPTPTPTTEPTPTPTTEPTPTPTTEPTPTPTTEPTPTPTTTPEAEVTPTPSPTDPATPAPTPSGTTEAETGTPRITPPSTDAGAGAGGASSAGNGWSLAMLALGGLALAALLLRPVARRSDR